MIFRGFQMRYRFEKRPVTELNGRVYHKGPKGQRFHFQDLGKRAALA